MIQFDESQLAALALDPGKHARVLGAPGSGKTLVLVESCARLVTDAGWEEDDVLVLAPNRLVAAQLRSQFERRVDRALGVAPVRTAASFAFSVLARASALEGHDAPRLLTGTAQDEEIAAVVESGVTGAANGRARVAPSIAGLTPEVLMSPAFRAELRELWRVIDDFGLQPATFAAELGALDAATGKTAFSLAPPAELLGRWRDGLTLISAVADRLGETRPGELSSSALLRDAAAVIRAAGAVRVPGVVGAAADFTKLRVPRLLFIDDAQELGEGELALVAACAAAGAHVWAFGDPDTATGAFRGERTAMLTQLVSELARRGGADGSAAAASVATTPEQAVVLQLVHRHGTELRDFVRGLSTRIGAAGAGQQRVAVAAQPAPVTADPSAASLQPARPSVTFAAAASPAEQLGVIAHRLRARRLGLDGSGTTEWNHMAVMCRSRSEALRVARALAAHQVPTGIAAGGIVLREHQIVRELIRLLQHALGHAPLSADDVLRIAGGVIGGLDPVAIRRLRGALLLHERRSARAEEREPESIADVVLEAISFPGETPIIDTVGGRALRRVGLLLASGLKVSAAGGTPRETLWALWDGTGLAERWQEEALEARGARADEAGRSLDAVLGLFFALQRHEEQDSDQPIPELLDDLLLSAVPEDSLAQRSKRSEVTVTTPQGALGREFDLVAVVGLQDGAWPNLRARGSLLGTAALERWLRGGAAAAPSRRDTVHDELRLFLQVCARARDELLVVAVSDEDQHPSAFFGLGSVHRRDDLPSARLTLRGVTADMRRRLVRDPADSTALAGLVALSHEGVPGAHPDDWYGVLAPSTTAPLHDLAGDPDTRVSVSPSYLERAETCPLDWVIASLGGGAGSVQASLGTLVHHALETATAPDAEALLATVLTEWNKLPFEAEWQSERTLTTARAMTEGLAAYLRDFDSSDRELLGRESRFAIEIEHAMLRGVADRLEIITRADGVREVSVLDLKTGRAVPSKAAAEEHAQLQAYQLGVDLNAFTPQIDRGKPAAGNDTSAAQSETAAASVETSQATGVAVPELSATAPDDAADGAQQTKGSQTNAHGVIPEDAVSGGARLLYVHPDATKHSDYVERVQQPLSEDAKAQFMARVADIAKVMAAGAFTARVEHHCSDPHQPGDCRLHIIPAVSHA